MGANDINAKTYPNDECRVKSIRGITLLARCQVEDAKPCSHALVLEYGVLCRHPEWQRMMIGDQKE